MSKDSLELKAVDEAEWGVIGLLAPPVVVLVVVGVVDEEIGAGAGASEWEIERPWP